MHPHLCRERHVDASSDRHQHPVVVCWPLLLLGAVAGLVRAQVASCGRSGSPSRPGQPGHIDGRSCAGAATDPRAGDLDGGCRRRAAGRLRAGRPRRASRRRRPVRDRGRLVRPMFREFRSSSCASMPRVSCSGLRPPCAPSRSGSACRPASAGSSPDRGIGWLANLVMRGRRLARAVGLAMRPLALLLLAPWVSIAARSAAFRLQGARGHVRRHGRGHRGLRPRDETNRYTLADPIMPKHWWARRWPPFLGPGLPATD